MDEITKQINDKERVAEKFRERGIQTRSFDEILSHSERHSTILQKLKTARIEIDCLESSNKELCAKLS